MVGHVVDPTIRNDGACTPMNANAERYPQVGIAISVRHAPRGDQRPTKRLPDRAGV